MHPSDEQIRLAQSSIKKSEKEKHKEQKQKQAEKRSRSRKRARSKTRKTDDNGAISSDDNAQLTNEDLAKNANWTLEASRINSQDLAILHFYPEYQWLIDFAFCAIIVFLLTEVYYYVKPDTIELNLSLVWLNLVLVFTLKTMFSLTRLYFKGDDAIGERSVCLTSGSIYFLVAMVVLSGNESFIELGLNDAYKNFNESARSYLVNHGLTYDNSGPLSFLLAKFVLALWCGLIGGLFTFPGLRLAQMHKDALKYAEGRPVLR